MSNRRTFLKQSVLGDGALSPGLLPNELFASGELVKLTEVLFDCAGKMKNPVAVINNL